MHLAGSGIAGLTNMDYQRCTGTELGGVKLLRVECVWPGSARKRHSPVAC